MPNQITQYAPPDNNDSNLLSLVQSSAAHYNIPEEEFSRNFVKRGLREANGAGVMAGITRKGNAHGYVLSEGELMPIEGELFYCGYNIEDLAKGFLSENRFGFEETAFILLFGHLPTKSELDKFCELLDESRCLPPRFTEDIIMKAPSTSVMNKMASAVLSLYAYDDDPDSLNIENLVRQSIQLIAVLPIIAAHSFAVYRNHFFGKSLTLHNPHLNRSTAQSFLRMLRPNKEYTDEEAKLLDLCLMLHAEHGGGNNSTFTCRCVSSTGSDTYSAIAAAIGSLKGPKHGGANIKVREMMKYMTENLKDPKDDDEVVSILRKILRGEGNDGSGLIYGMGHAVYTLSDPRSVILKKNARILAEKKGMLDAFELNEAVERLTARAIFEERGTNKPICANVDLYSGFVYHMLDIPEEMYTPLFTIARIAGWCGHRIEECQSAKKIIRPAYKYISENPVYVPIDKR